jgi:hypothetical protein
MKVIDNDGRIYESINSFCRKRKCSKTILIREFKKNGTYTNPRGFSAKPYGEGAIADTISNEGLEAKEEFENFKAARTTEYKLFKIDQPTSKEDYRYAIALFSDAHIEESVDADSVLGLNHYDTSVATERVSTYFANLSACLKKDCVDALYFASLGDTMSGYIHEHLMEENGLTPPQATILGQSLIVSGLRHIRQTLPTLKIYFIGISGNHSRTTKKMQNSNGFKLSYEWIMYQNIKQICDGMDIEFIIPDSELALVQTPDNKRYIFCHGYQVQSKGTGTVAGIYPALNRLAMKWQRTFQQDKIFLGHYHTCVSIPAATVNGSIIGYNAFALSNGMGYEEPAQMYEVFANGRKLLSREIYCK